MTRVQVSRESLMRAKEFVHALLDYRLDEKGRGTFASRHEILGSVQEEMHELEHAIHENKSLSEVKKELADLAVGALFGIACINEETLDW